MSKQVQIRRDTASNINATTPAQGELGYDITNRRLRAGNGTMAGGIILPNAFDLQQHPFDYAVAGGTADALTLTLAPALESYGNGCTVKFKAAANNTGAATINVNGLGAKNIYKKSGGTIGALAADDIINGGCYTLTYDGTQFQLEAASPNIILDIHQGNLNTSSGVVSVNSTQTSLILPGGSYGFYPQLRYTGSNVASYAVFHGAAGSLSLGSNLQIVAPAGEMTTSFTTRLKLGAAGGQQLYAQQLYVNASAPWDMGADGAAVGLFIFALVHQSTGEIAAVYQADTPPWGYNGPTDVVCRRLCPKTGKKQRLVQLRSIDDLMNGADPKWDYETITPALKMADMDLLPQPFGEIPAGHDVVLLDPMDDRLASLAAYHAAGGGHEITEALYAGKIYADNEVLSKRAGPKGLKQVGLRFKYSRK